jgi:hypothetical protein
VQARVYGKERRRKLSTLAQSGTGLGRYSLLKKGRRGFASSGEGDRTPRGPFSGSAHVPLCARGLVMFSARITVPAAPRTRADAQRSLVKRIAFALALFALVGLVCWRIYATTPLPAPQPPRAGLDARVYAAGELRHFSRPRLRPIVAGRSDQDEQLHSVRSL